MKKITGCICMMVLAVMALAGTVYAGERAGAFSVSPFIGGYVFDDDDQAQWRQNRPLGGLRLGYDFTDHFATELVGTYMKGELKANDHNVGIYSYRLDLLYNFMPDTAMVPYVALGGGGTTIRYRGPNSHDGTFDAGGGVKLFMNEDVALRLDARHIIDFQRGNLDRDFANNWEYSAGVTFVFGGRQAAPAVAAEPVREPVKTEPPLEPVPAAEPTPGHYKYCITLQGEFDVDKAIIRPEYRDEIAQVGNFMKKYPTTTAVIEGHTDNMGTSEQNMKLSQQRAENVVKYLVDNFGIERSRLAAKGYGATRRVSYNNTPEGRQNNRRINAVIDCVVTK